MSVALETWDGSTFADGTRYAYGFFSGVRVPSLLHRM